MFVKTSHVTFCAFYSMWLLLKENKTNFEHCSNMQAELCMVWVYWFFEMQTKMIEVLINMWFLMFESFHTEMLEKLYYTDRLIERL